MSEINKIENRIMTCIKHLKVAGLLDDLPANKELSDEEITVLINSQGLADIPYALRFYLRKMGRMPGRFMCGSDYGEKGIPRLKEALMEILEGTDKTLPSNAFVYFGHQDYHFCFIDVQGVNNPKVTTVYIRDENSIQFIDDYNFIEWLENYVNFEISI